MSKISIFKTKLQHVQEQVRNARGAALGFLSDTDASITKRQRVVDSLAEQIQVERENITQETIQFGEVSKHLAALQSIEDSLTAKGN